jgi:hypothetical protein
LKLVKLNVSGYILAKIGSFWKICVDSIIVERFTPCLI